MKWFSKPTPWHKQTIPKPFSVKIFLTLEAQLRLPASCFINRSISYACLQIRDIGDLCNFIQYSIHFTVVMIYNGYLPVSHHICNAMVAGEAVSAVWNPERLHWFCGLPDSLCTKSEEPWCHPWLRLVHETTNQHMSLTFSVCILSVALSSVSSLSSEPGK